MDKQLLEILCCPETKQPVALADNTLIEKINQQIAAGTLKNRAGQAVTEKITAGLIREDKKWLYLVRDEIPVMLTEEAISLEGLS